MSSVARVSASQLPIGKPISPDDFCVGVAFVHIDALRPALMVVDQLGVVHSQQVHDGRVQIVDVEFVFHRVEAEVVSRADALTAAHPAAGHPHRETARVVVAAAGLLSHRRAAKLTTPNDERLVEQAARFQIGEEAGDGFVHGATERAVAFLELRVAVPAAARTAVQLHETHAAVSLERSTVPGAWACMA